MKHFHDLPRAVHLGVDKTLEKIKISFYRPKMREFVREYCRSCDKFFSRKPKRHKKEHPFDLMPAVD